MNIFQLQKSDLTRLTQTQISQLADLIYETDTYIFPAAFNDKNTGIIVLTELIKRHDPMFCLENMFVAESGANFIGGILWHKGPLCVSAEGIRLIFDELKIAPPDSLEAVHNEYFRSYENTSKDTIALLNVSVAKEHRGRGIGGKLMKAFCNLHYGEEMELCVLSENEAAVRLYKAVGFIPILERDGFSLETEKPKCFDMKRIPRRTSKV